LALFFYNIFLLLYKSGIYLSSIWNNKAKLWVNGRQDIFSRLTNELEPHNSEIIWFHCSSLGEFEQGRPVIEKIKSQFPTSKILLTFFSPSGFEIRKDYEGVAWVFYLPLDSKKNARQFLDIVRPSLVVFVKYDYWYYYLTECSRRKISLLMISSIFRKDQAFFKWYGSLHRKMLQCFSYIFVQDSQSLQLLESINIKKASIAGDTRFDRVSEIAATFKPVGEIAKFCGTSQVLIAGSTWPADEKLIKDAAATLPDIKIIIAPHETNKEHLQELKSLFQGSIYFSELKTYGSAPTTQRYLIIDNIGMLSRLYYYASVTYVGGGFNRGIHNTLEAAVYGKPVLFGPNYEKFREAIGLIEAGGGVCINSSTELTSQLKKILTTQSELAVRSKKSFDFVQGNKGATQKILNYIQENRLLTN
jgi:3-deoxy-D-manno-octulosonic-acid transferase